MNNIKLKFLRQAFATILTFAVTAPLPSAAETHIASWNIRNLGWDNGKDYAALADIGARFDFISVQEVMSQDGIDQMQAALEAHSGEIWEQLCSHLIGRGSYREMYCFIWRDGSVTWIDGAVVYTDDRDLFAREPFSARFETHDGIRFVATSVHSIYGDSVAVRQAEATALRSYHDWLTEAFPDTPVLLMGDFNLAPTNPAWGPLGAIAHPLIQDGATTISTIEGRYANLYDNIWVPADTDLQISGAGRLPFPQVLGVSHEHARDAISDHIPVYLTLDAAISPVQYAPHMKTDYQEDAQVPDETPAPPVIGNRNSAIFHTPDCPGYSRTGAANRVAFDSTEAAIAEGYRKARNC